MKIKMYSAAIGAGAILALAAGIPAQAQEVDGSGHAARSSTPTISAQTLRALRAEWLAQEASYKEMQARAQAAKALEASGWTTEAKVYYSLP